MLSGPIMAMAMVSTRAMRVVKARVEAVPKIRSNRKPVHRKGHRIWGPEGKGYMV